MKKFTIVFGIFILAFIGLSFTGAFAKKAPEPEPIPIPTYDQVAEDYVRQMDYLIDDIEVLQLSWITYNEGVLQNKLTDAGARLDSEEIARIGRRFAELKTEKKWLDKNSPRIVFTTAQ